MKLLVGTLLSQSVSIVLKISKWPSLRYLKRDKSKIMTRYQHHRKSEQQILY